MASSSATSSMQVATVVPNLHLVLKGYRPGIADRVAQGEGPLWDDSLGVLYWLDNTDGNIFRYDASSGEHIAVSIGHELGFFALTEKADQVLLLGKHGISLFDWATLKEYPLLGVPKSPGGNLSGDPDPLLRFNEGAVDARGRLLAGTYCMDEAGGKDRSELYSIVATGHQDCTQPQLAILHILVTKCWIPNGIAFNKDSSHMYWVDSMLRGIERFDYNLESGSVSNRSTLLQFPKEYGLPDGMTIDEGGDLWVAHFVRDQTRCKYGGSRVSRSSPSGRILSILPIPVNQVPSLTFGGASMRDLFVVTGARNVDYKTEPLAGSLLMCKEIGVKGTTANRFRGKIALNENKAIQRERRETVVSKPIAIENS